MLSTGLVRLLHAKWFSYVIKPLTFSFFVDKWGPHIWWDIFMGNISGFLIYLIVSFSSTAVHVAQQETDLSHRCIARKIFNILHMAEPCQQIPKCSLENSSEWWRLPADLEVPWNCWVWHFLLLTLKTSIYSLSSSCVIIGEVWQLKLLLIFIP